MEGFDEYDKRAPEKLVCKLKMTLKGGRQSGHLWQQANMGQTVHLHPHQARGLVSPRHSLN
eukprot:5509895-Pleurochrysis_carterae.AAC.3